MVPRLREIFRQLEAEVVSTTRNRFHQTWRPLFSPPLHPSHVEWPWPWPRFSQPRPARLRPPSSHLSPSTSGLFRSRPPQITRPGNCVSKCRWHSFFWTAHLIHWSYVVKKHLKLQNLWFSPLFLVNAQYMTIQLNFFEDLNIQKVSSNSKAVRCCPYHHPSPIIFLPSPLRSVGAKHRCSAPRKVDSNANK